MKVNNYEFEMGDEVITIFGQKGKIIHICDCEECRKRGFCEPVWRMDVGNPRHNYITISDAEQGFNRFFKIGKYHFNDFAKDTLFGEIRRHEREIEDLKKRLEFIDSVEKEGKEIIDIYGSKTIN